MGATVVESLKLVLRHTGMAGAMALIFFAGALCALPVLRWQVRALLVVPRWFAGTLARVINAGLSVPELALFIFLFNGSAMLAYMLSGLIPWLPAVVTFSTGLNVVAAGLLGKESMPPPQTSRRVPLSGALCGGLTFVLELPCFWYTMAMGWTMEPHIIGLLKGTNAVPLLNRLIAYAIIVLPVLAVSAFAEAYAVLESRRA